MQYVIPHCVVTEIRCKNIFQQEIMDFSIFSIIYAFDMILTYMIIQLCKQLYLRYRNQHNWNLEYYLETVQKFIAVRHYLMVKDMIQEEHLIGIYLVEKKQSKQLVDTEKNPVSKILDFAYQLIFYDKNNDFEGSVIHVLEVLLLLVAKTS